MTIYECDIRFVSNFNTDDSSSAGEWRRVLVVCRIAGGGDVPVADPGGRMRGVYPHRHVVGSPSFSGGEDARHRGTPDSHVQFLVALVS